MKSFNQFMNDVQRLDENPVQNLVNTIKKVLPKKGPEPSFMDSISSDQSGADAALQRAPAFNKNPNIKYSVKSGPGQGNKSVTQPGVDPKFRGVT
jgi:hypothetical protein